ncbi:UvrD-helicase domain-containing protein [Aeromonas media]|uniref:UvrD-helicase domain-containing protein n=1 Tax=Aeromonas TaxID=642 RepID=UPI0022E86906|nr:MULTISPECIES: UvrD-helicase domain-containing protein [Aeromonas]WED80837.1 UvrD-helicase domain-containing protein [Aeromonas media]
MKFIAFEKEIAIKIVNTRQLQSTEFDEGKAFVNILRGISNGEEFMFPCHSLQNGLVFTENLKNDECLIFDLDLFDGFSIATENECLTIVQKSLRAAIKSWNNIPFGVAEINKQEAALLIVFPHASNYRVVIDKKPDSKRQEKRNGKHLLAFSYVKTEISNQPPYTNFRKFLEEVKDVTIRDAIRNIPYKFPIEIAELEDGFSPVDARIGFDAWKNLLTKSQKDFVMSGSFGASCLEGPAGTGKTLCLILKSIQAALSESFSGKSIMFVTHSTATRDHVNEVIKANVTAEQLTYINSSCQIKVCTLQDWCLERIGGQLEESELLDKDAESSKTYQQILIEESLLDFISNDYKSFSRLISKELADSLSPDNSNAIITALRHEISEVIKGRAGQNLESYKKIDYSIHAIPITNELDAECVFSIYRNYQSKLESVGNFDSDDIVITALNQLDSPIWRRRKNKEGYDFVFIDETHLFNLNELSVIHHILKDEAIHNVAYSVDRSQAIANSSPSKVQLESIFKETNGQKLQTVFRSSPDIVRLAFDVLSTGAGFFTSLENPLVDTETSFTQEDENRSIPPTLVTYSTDELVLGSAFKEVDLLASKINTIKSKICIIPCNEMILSQLMRMVEDNKKSCEFILKRGDRSLQSKAERGGKYLIAGIDYVGGLEFDGVVIVGCDKGNFPSVDERTGNARHFIQHACYNRLYVAITRAKYALTIISNRSRGISEILSPSLEKLNIDNK